MYELIQAIPFSVAALFPVVNPLGSAVIFLAMTDGISDSERRKLAAKVAINSFLLLFMVLLTGSWILRFFGISLSVVQIGGGLVVAHIGWILLNRPVNGGKQQSVQVDSDKDASQMAFFPLTMPVTAGPGAIAVTLTIGAHEIATNSVTTTVMAELGVAIGILLVAILVFFCNRYAANVTSKLGPSGMQVIIRLAAFINLCIGIQILWRGIQGLFH